MSHTNSVTVHRGVATMVATIEVEADSPRDARRKASTKFRQRAAAWQPCAEVTANYDVYNDIDSTGVEETES